MRVLITGGLGFLGQAVTRQLLAAGHTVTVMTSSSSPHRAAPAPGAELVRADIRNRQAIADVVAAGRFEGVCHLAALTRGRDSVADPIGYFDVNVSGTLNLLAALDSETARSGRPARLVFASTHAVYGAQEGALGEDQQPAPSNPYGASKWAAEQAIGYQAATGRLAAVTLRCFNVAGAAAGHGDQDLTRIIPKTLAVAAGQADKLQINGDGAAVREYTHVLDAADAFTLALHSTSGHQTLNVGTGKGFTLAEVLTTARRITGKAIPAEHLPPKPEAQIVVADGTRIQKELGWAATRSTLEEILQDGWATLASAAA